jgi:hypothetical protein
LNTIDSPEIRPVPFSFTPTRRATLAMLAGLTVTPAMAAGASLNDVARYLAGLPVSSGSVLEPLTQEPIWRAHAQQLDAAWKRLDSEQLAKIRNWSSTHVTSPNRTLLYMFSGPDYLYARAFILKRALMCSQVSSFRALSLMSLL